MNTEVDEIADGIYRLSTFIPDAGMAFNQILVDADQPFLFHTGMRGIFPLVADAVARVMPLERLRWISFGHVEADECGAMNHWLAVAPRAEVTFGALGCMVSVNDLADRPPRSLNDGEVMDIGGKRLRYFATPHVPHGWDAGVFFEETTNTLLCGDLFTQAGQMRAVSDDSPMDATIAAEEAFRYTCLSPATKATIEALAALEPSTLALMHGPAHVGAGGDWLRELASYYSGQTSAATA